LDALDLDSFPLVDKPSGFDKLGGPFVPGMNAEEILLTDADRQEMKNYTQRNYYLASLSFDQLHQYSPRFLSSKALSAIKWLDDQAFDVLEGVINNTFSRDIKSGLLDVKTAQLINKIIQCVGLVDGVWCHIEKEVVVKLEVLFKPFISDQRSFDRAVSRLRTDYRKPFINSDSCAKFGVSSEALPGQAFSIAASASSLFYSNAGEQRQQLYMDWLFQNRHNDAEIRQEFDRRYGLVLVNDGAADVVSPEEEAASMRAH